jgi:hypothetical protein
LGYVEGEYLIIERYSAEGHHERYAGLVREIVARNPDVIVTGTNPVVIAFKAATSTIPVVAFMLDPLHAGLVASLGRPGGNLTGITLDAGIEIWGKRLAILKEAIPSTAKAAFLGMREGWEGTRRFSKQAKPRTSQLSLQSGGPAMDDGRPHHHVQDRLFRSRTVDALARSGRSRCHPAGHHDHAGR